MPRLVWLGCWAPTRVCAHLRQAEYSQLQAAARRSSSDLKTQPCSSDNIMLQIAARVASRTAARRVAVRTLASKDPPEITPAQKVGLSDELEQRASRRWAELATEHRKIPADDAVRRKRLIYRSKQRGWLEVDLLLGSWAAENVATLTKEECDAYEHILNCETIDIFNFITGKDPVPPRLDTPVMKRLQDYCASAPLGTDPDAYAAAKTDANLT